MPQFQTEDELTTWLRSRGPAIGDDAAFLRSGRDLALSTDSQREGVHFPPNTGPANVARRLLAVNLSDLAAVGAAPKYALCTLASPASWDRREFFEGLLGACHRFGVELIGGDLSKSSEVHTSLTIIGERVQAGRFLQRSNARPGQAVWLAGFLGESHLGLRLGMAPDLAGALSGDLETAAQVFERRHRLPEPQLEVGAWLARRRSTIAAIDISDGLALDAQRLARASGVDLRFSEVELALASSNPEAFRQIAARLEIDPMQARLAGGEDYALLFTADEDLSPQLLALARSHTLRRIGDVCTGSGECRVQLDAGGTAREVACSDLLPANSLGWDHLR